jgi:putative flavoprotein involved in K+ transport
VLVVGAGNSGADISIELVRTHPTWLSGRYPSHVPVHVDSTIVKRTVLPIVRFLGTHVLTTRTPMGRKARQTEREQGGRLVRVKPKWLERAGVEHVGKTAGAKDGKPMLEDGQVLDVANVIWCTGFRQDLSWVDLPITDEDGEVVHRRGLVPAVPGLAFVGLEFQYSATSGVVLGMPRDARYVVEHLDGRTPRRQTIAAA